MLYLASQSPRRRELLAVLGVDFAVLDVEVPEQRATNESPREYVSRVARDKAYAGLHALDTYAGPRAALGAQVGHVVLGADTEVVLDDEVFGKPRDDVDATAMLRRLSGRTHEVITIVWLVSANDEYTDTCLSQVRFAPLDEAAIAAYVASGEPRGKAGAYAIQGRGATLAEYLQGSYSGVMGLPLFETARLLRRCGIPNSRRASTSPRRTSC